MACQGPVTRQAQSPSVPPPHDPLNARKNPIQPSPFFPESPLCGILPPVTHCKILAHTFLRKECSSQRNNNDNSDLPPAPLRLWPEKRWVDPFDWS